ncbi:MAG: LL-diaminopimelate aminotransferase [Candidatus Omnitrophica bacterium]|nr:LL-diaminopimelate aminotransferase [Candidatus Omnitrophota bacterium]
MHEALRLKRLPAYLFTILDHMKAEARSRGVDVIDLGMGNPDQPVPPHIVNALCKAARKPDSHRYSRSDGALEKNLRRAIARWYDSRFGVKLDPEHEVLPLIGSKEGIAHLSMAFLNNDDIALVPSPAYPVHFNGVIIAGGILYNLPLYKERGYLPDLGSVQRDIVKRSKLLILSYPNNPTTAVAPLEFFKDVVKWAQGRNLIVCHDNAYSDIVFDGYRAPSILEVKGASGCAVEFHTCSKSYNMAGWRIGFVVGNAEILRTLEKVKSYIDFGLFRAIQEATVTALTGPQQCVKQIVATYKKRRDVFVNGLNRIGWKVDMPQATFYVWAHIPPKYSGLTSMEFSELLVREAGVAASPGTGFGEYGEGFVRFALVADEDRLREAVRRIKALLEVQT